MLQPFDNTIDYFANSGRYNYVDIIFSHIEKSDHYNIQDYGDKIAEVAQQALFDNSNEGPRFASHLLQNYGQNIHSVNLANVIQTSVETGHAETAYQGLDALNAQGNTGPASAEAAQKLTQTVEYASSSNNSEIVRFSQDAASYIENLGLEVNPVADEFIFEDPSSIPEDDGAILRDSFEGPASPQVLPDHSVSLTLDAAYDDAGLVYTDDFVF